jgi:DNA-binding NarL/FixJ family response regulator
MSPQISVALADDHQLFLSGLKRIIEESGKFKVLHTSRSGSQLLANIALEMPDIIISDLSMPPGIDGAVLVEKIKTLYPNSRLVVLSMHNEPDVVVPIMKLDVAAYLLKDMNDSAIIYALERVWSEGFYWPEPIQQIMRAGLQAKFGNLVEELTEREIEYLKLLCKEKTTEEIAAHLDVSRRTIEYYRKTIMEKIDVKSTTGMVVFAIKNGIA